MLGFSFKFVVLVVCWTVFGASGSTFQEHLVWATFVFEILWWKWCRAFFHFDTFVTESKIADKSWCTSASNHALFGTGFRLSFKFVVLVVCWTVFGASGSTFQEHLIWATIVFESLWWKWCKAFFHFDTFITKSKITDESWCTSASNQTLLGTALGFSFKFMVLVVSRTMFGTSCSTLQVHLVWTTFGV